MTGLCRLVAEDLAVLESGVGRAGRGGPRRGSDGRLRVVATGVRRRARTAVGAAPAAIRRSGRPARRWWRWVGSPTARSARRHRPDGRFGRAERRSRCPAGLTVLVHRPRQAVDTGRRPGWMDCAPRRGGGEGTEEAGWAQVPTRSAARSRTTAGTGSTSGSYRTGAVRRSGCGTGGCAPSSPPCWSSRRWRSWCWPGCRPAGWSGRPPSLSDFAQQVGIGRQITARGGPAPAGAGPHRG